MQLCLGRALWRSEGGGGTSMDSALKGCWFESWSRLGEPVAIKDHPPARSMAFLCLKTELSIFFFNKKVSGIQPFEGDQERSI